MTLTFCEIITFNLTKWSRFDSDRFEIGLGRELQRRRIRCWFLCDLQDGGKNDQFISNCFPLIQQRNIGTRTHTQTSASSSSFARPGKSRPAVRLSVCSLVHSYSHSNGGQYPSSMLSKVHRLTTRPPVRSPIFQAQCFLHYQSHFIYDTPMCAVISYVIINHACIHESRFQYATTPAFPIRHAAHSIRSSNTLSLGSGKPNCEIRCIVRCSCSYILEQIFNYYITTKRERSQ